MLVVSCKSSHHSYRLSSATADEQTHSGFAAHSTTLMLVSIPFMMWRGVDNPQAISVSSSCPTVAAP